MWLQCETLELFWAVILIMRGIDYWYWDAGRTISVLTSTEMLLMLSDIF